MAASEPFALVARGPKGLALAGLNPAARALGLRLGQAHADACAIAPSLRSEPQTPGQAHAALRRLALWAQRYGPLTVCDDAAPGWEGLWLDTTGVDHLFGGEAALIADLSARLRRMGADPRIGLAGTPGAAWALARFAAEDARIAPPGAEVQALAALPMAGLRLSPEAVKLLHRFGLKRIGDLQALPRGVLARRFRGDLGMRALYRLDQALGVAPEPMTGETAPSPHVVQQMFAEPILSSEGVALWGAQLAARLCAGLEQAGVGARRLTLTGFRSDGRTTRYSAALGCPSRDPDHLIRLLRERGWERLDLGFGLDALRLRAPVIEPLGFSQTQWDMGEEAGGEIGARDGALAALIDRLSARLGEKALLRPAFRESWAPERAERLAPCGGGMSASRSAPPEAAPPDRPRPILLFTPPEPIDAVAELPDGAPARFTWRRVARRVVRASGPERLSPEWWRRPVSQAQASEQNTESRATRTRDYYRIEDEGGGRYWVFREGLYDAPETDQESAAPSPSWWMHGLFP